MLRNKNTIKGGNPVHKSADAKSTDRSAVKPDPTAATSEEENEPELTREELLRDILYAKKAALMRAARQELAKQTSGSIRDLAETANDDGDWSVISMEEDLALSKMSTQKKTIDMIDDAIHKLNEDSYGICEQCEEDINPKRLKVMPFAVLCRDCQEENEKYEEATRQDIFA